jgi:hypothetical protein
MNTHTHTTPGGDTFLPVIIITHPRRNLNRRRPPEPSPLGVWILLALAIIFSSLTTYLLTK